MESLADLLGQAPGITALRQQVRRIVERTSHAQRLPPILLQGETGTGKNLVAGVIHRIGPRSRGPFVDVNCAAIPAGLLEAELFGFERGAFTDARQPKAGLFQSADGGTIFLDEIGLLSDALQAKLLKVIEDRTVRRLGGTRSEPVDISIVAATNEDLLAAVQAGRFRQDLYHRLAVLTLCLPPLRERRDDITALAAHFLERACKDYGLRPKVLTPGAGAALVAYGWPGNVRELANVMERAALLTETSRILPEMLDLPTATASVHSAPSAPAPSDASLDARVEGWERQELLRALEATRWNVARAAARLGITRGTIRYRIDKYGLEPAPRRTRRRRLARISPAPPPPPSAPATPAVARWEPRLVALLQVAVRPSNADEFPAEFGRDFDVLVQKVEIFAGRIEEAGPSRVIAAFGVDPAEDGPRRAALAALAMQNALARVRPAQARRPAVTFAIHAEQCPVAEVSGRVRVDADAKRRMAMVLEEFGATAEPDTIVVSQTARSLLGPRFDFGRATEADGPSSRPSRLLAYCQDRFGIGGHPGPFVGRDRELGVLGLRWQEARQGTGQVVSVVGEPGIGKSRLLFEFRRTLGDDVVYLEGRGESYGGSIPYRPVIDLLKAYFGVDERDAPRVVGQRVQAQLLALDGALAPDVPALLALLDAPDVDPQWQTLDPSQRRQRTLDALKRLVLRVSQARPVLLVVEDLHWIDAETQAFLDRLVVSVPAARLLLVVSHRPEYRHAWGSATSYTQLHLDPLPTVSAEALVGSLVGRDVAVQPLGRLLIERADGNPFFLEESVRTLVEARALIGERGAYRPAQDVHTLRVPATVRAVLATRIERLPAADRQVLLAAAVVGKDVPFALLQAVADVPEATLRSALTNLHAAEFLRETRLFPDAEYTFKHALTHEVAYEALVPDRQRALHARMVEALEHVYAERLPEQVARLAHHALSAALWPKALAYCRQAGARAAWRSAHREAVQHFEDALRAIRALPDTRSPARVVETLDLHRQLRWSLVPLGEYARLTVSLRDAAALAERSGDRRQLGEVSQSMTNYLRLIGDCDGALAAGERARALAAALGDRHLDVRATYQLGLVHRQLGDYEGAIRALSSVVDALGGELIYERFGEPSVLSVHARSWLATALAETGRFTDGIARGEESIGIAESAKNTFSLAQACNGLGFLYLRRQNLGDAARLLERSMSLCRDGNFLLLLPIAASTLGAVYTLTGRVADALPLLELAAETASARGLVASSPLYLAHLGQARLLGGRLEEAQTLAVRALEVARTYRERGHEAWVLHLLGDIAGRGDSPEAAAGPYAEALALARTLGMRPLVAQCLGRLGVLHRRAGDPERARERLSEATTMFGEMGMRGLLTRTEAELAALG